MGLRKTAIITVCILPLLVAIGCKSSRQVDKISQERYIQVLVFDKSVPFPESGIYAWHPPNERRNMERVPEHDLILKAMEEGLANRGYRLARGVQQPDFFIAYHLIDDGGQDDAALNKHYTFKDPERWMPGADTPNTYGSRTLVADLVCASDYCPRWRSSVSVAVPKEMKDKEKLALLKRLVRRIVRNLPPDNSRRIPLAPGRVEA